jgi:hypothetical protein
MKERLIEAANLLLVCLGFYIAVHYQTPITIAIGAISFLLGLLDTGITKR